MDETAMYKMPTIDFSVPSLLALAQLGIFAVFTIWTLEGASDNDLTYILPLATSMGGLSLFLSVPNSRIAVTAGIPILMIVLSVILGESGMAFWAIFMVIFFGAASYLPALAVGDETLGLDDEDRMMRMGALWILFALLLMFLLGTMEGAVDGKFTDEDSEGNELIVELDSDQQMISQGALAVGLIGVVVFLTTGVLGMEVSELRPWHGGALVSGALCITAYLWHVAGEFAPEDYGMILAFCGIMTLTPCAAYEGGDSPSGSEAGTESE